MAEEPGLGKVVASLASSLATRLGLSPQYSLTPALVTALARRLGLRGPGQGLVQLLARMKGFGLDLSHVEEGRVGGEEVQQYFVLDLVKVLLDSIEQVTS